MNIELEDVSCPICDVANDSYVLTGKDLLLGLPGKYNIVKCNNCNLMRTNPRPTPESIGFYYPENYGPYVGTRVEGNSIKSSKLKKYIKHIINLIFEFKTTYTPKLPKGKMLEIGCASGAYMHKMSKAGWQVSGIEYSEKASTEARSLGYDVFTGPLEQAPNPNGSYDMIVGWMVLEHLHDPKACLKKLYDWSNKHTKLVLSVPNAGCFHLKLFNGMWHDLHLPNHLYHFNTTSIKNLLLESGWQIDKIHHHRLLGNFFASFGNILNKKGYSRLSKIFLKLPKYSNYFLYPFALILSWFGQTGRMTVWARKINDD